MNVSKVLQRVCDRLQATLDNWEDPASNRIKVELAVVELETLLELDIDQVLQRSSQLESYQPPKIDLEATEIRQLRARQTEQEVRRVAMQQESGAVLMVVCDDGPMEGTAVPIHPQMPVGAYANVAGIRYQLREQTVPRGTVKLLVQS